MRPELHDGRDDLGRNLREFGDERRGKRLLDLRLVFSEAAGALDLEQVLDFRVHAAAAAFSGDGVVIFGGGVPCLSFAPVFGDSVRVVMT